MMSFPERGLVGFQVLRLGFLLCMVELSHLHLEGLGLAIIAGRVFCGQSLVLGGPQGQGLATCWTYTKVSANPFLSIDL